MTQANNVGQLTPQVNSSGVLQVAGGGTGLSAVGTSGYVLASNGSGNVYVSAVGYSGYSGYSGTAGSNGTSGFSGISGYSGFSGRSGFSGSNGTNGSTGTSGYSGYSGSAPNSQSSASAWCNYNAVTKTITTSYNISSVTYNSSGNLTFNMTNALADANYAIFYTGDRSSGQNYPNIGFMYSASAAPTSSAFTIQVLQQSGGGQVTADLAKTFVLVFR